MLASGAAGRMVRAESVTVTLVYTYNAQGLRVAQSAESSQSVFSWDWASGLPEMLSEGSNLYLLVGHDTLGQFTGDEWAYYLLDALGSVRQETDAAGAVLDSREWTPYGIEVGTAQAGLGYTGEWYDSYIEFTYLRARWLDPQTGMFTRKDPWKGSPQQPGTYNGFNYAMGNPINLKDPTGFQVDSPGARFMAWCFDLHSGSHGVYWTGDEHNPFWTVSAKEAVEICRESYNMNNWSRDDFRLGGDLPKRAHDLFGWFLFNWRGTYNSDRLFFDGNQALTRELVNGHLIGDLRIRHYHGEDLSGPTHYDFNLAEFAGTIGFDTPYAHRSLPLSFVMGSFWYQVKTVGSDRIGFRIDNNMDLESGSHIAGRFPPEYDKTVEDLIAQDPGLENTPLHLLIANQQYRLVSILRSRTRGELEGSQGGGSLYQTFTWTESRFCSPVGILDIEVWDNFRSMTIDPPGFPPVDSAPYPYLPIVTR